LYIQPMPTPPTPEEIATTIAEECLAVRVRLLNRVVSGVYDHALRPLGITAGQMNILVVVAKGGALAPGEIARVLHMEKSTLSRNLERMRRQGWVEVAPGEAGRGLVATIAPAGETLLRDALPHWHEAQVRVRELLGAEGADDLLRLAGRVWSQAPASR
jgi:DNA-binding MarR family transcriptional regulator